MFKSHIEQVEDVEGCVFLLPFLPIIQLKKRFFIDAYWIQSRQSLNVSVDWGNKW